jgi:hypothetical protein
MMQTEVGTMYREGKETGQLIDAALDDFSLSLERASRYCIGKLPGCLIACKVLS